MPNRWFKFNAINAVPRSMHPAPHTHAASIMCMFLLFCKVPITEGLHPRAKFDSKSATSYVPS